MQEPTGIVHAQHRFAARYHLPTPPTPLIGREQEVQAICALLQRPKMRLLTLTGPAGVGKTRLALQVAADLRDTFADGVCYVPLAVLTDPELVLAALAQSLGLREATDQPASVVLKTALRDLHLLLVLDNFEQVILAAPALADLLEYCPELTILVTSREVLRLRAEHQFSVPPLALPLLSQRGIPELCEDTALAQNPAVQLFLQRVQAVQPEFQLTPGNASLIAEICRRLEGLPLALELAAPRLKLLSPQALLARLEGRLQVLTGGARDLPERQRTMRATIQWSYDLLTPAEQMFFRRLAVFVGGWTLAAATQVCQAGGALDLEPLEGLASLLDKSLLRQEQTSTGDIRFRMLSILREFGSERLQEADELTATRDAHAAFFLALAEERDPSDWAQVQVWRDQLRQEQDNMREALSWWLAQAGQGGGSTPAERALRMCFALYDFWRPQGAWREAHYFYGRALALRAGVDQTIQARALASASDLLQYLGHPEQAEALAQEGLTLARQGGSPEAIAYALGRLGSVTTQQGQYAEARVLRKEEVALLQQIGDTLRRGICLVFLARLMLLQGEYEQAQALLEEGLTLFQRMGHQQRVGWVLCALAWHLCATQGDLARAATLAEEGLALLHAAGESWIIAEPLCILGAIRGQQGRLAEAHALVEEGLAKFQEQGGRADSFKWQNILGHLLGQQDHLAAAHALYQKTRASLPASGHKPSIADYLEGWGLIQAALGAPGTAARLWGAAEALREVVGAPMFPLYQDAYTQAITAARAQVGKDTLAAAWTEGRGMTIEAVLTAADSLPPMPAPRGPTAPALPEGLTARERDVLRLVARGLTNPQIARQLVISSLTVNAHLRSIYGKLGVNNRTEAALYARDHQLA